MIRTQIADMIAYRLKQAGYVVRLNVRTYYFNVQCTKGEFGQFRISINVGDISSLIFDELSRYTGTILTADPEFYDKVVDACEERYRSFVENP